MPSRGSAPKDFTGTGHIGTPYCAAIKILGSEKESRCLASITLFVKQGTHVDPPLSVRNGGRSSSAKFPEASQGPASQAGPSNDSRLGWSVLTPSAQEVCVQSGKTHDPGRQRQPEPRGHGGVICLPEQTSVFTWLQGGCSGAPGPVDTQTLLHTLFHCCHQLWFIFTQTLFS